MREILIFDLVVLVHCACVALPLAFALRRRRRARLTRPTAEHEQRTQGGLRSAYAEQKEMITNLMGLDRISG